MTLIVHGFLAVRVTPQVLVCAKSPEVSIAAKVTTASPVLVSFKVLAGLLVPILRAWNIKAAGETDRAPGVAVAVGVEVAVGVAVRVAVGVAVSVAVAVDVAVAVGVALRTGVRTEVAVAVGVGDADGVAVGVAHAATVADAELPTTNTCAWYG